MNKQIVLYLDIEKVILRKIGIKKLDDFLMDGFNLIHLCKMDGIKDLIRIYLYGGCNIAKFRKDMNKINAFDYEWDFNDETSLWIFLYTPMKDLLRIQLKESVQVKNLTDFF